jgi:hypothetical protein
MIQIYNLLIHVCICIYAGSTDSAYLQTVIRQLVFLRLKLLSAEESEKNIAETDIITAWQVYIHICICTYICMYVYVYARVCVYMYVYVNIYTYAYIHVLICMYIYICRKIKVETDIIPAWQVYVYICS